MLLPDRGQKQSEKDGAVWRKGKKKNEVMG